MSTITSGKSVKEMLAMRTEIDAAIIALGGGGKVKKASVKRPGTGGAWSAFSKKIIAENPEEVQAYKEAHPYDKADRKTAGAHLKWAGIYKAENEAEWLEFKAEWEIAHPKVAGSVASAASEADGDEGESSEEAAPSVVSAASASSSSTGKKRGPKKLADMTSEERAKHDAGVAARRAKKEAEKAAGEAAGKEEAVLAPVPAPAAVPVTKKAPKKVTVSAAPAAPATPEKKPAPAPSAPPAPKKPSRPAPPAPKVEPVKMTPIEESDDEEASFELFPFTMDGNSYFRLGCKGEDDEVEWEGHLWYNKDGKRGAYVGCLKEDGGFEEDAEEPEI